MNRCCNLCRGTDTVELYTITRFTRPFTVHRCSGCGLIFTKPMPAPDELAKLYDREYFTGSSKPGAFVYTDERKNPRGYQAVNRARIKKIISCLGRRSGNFLDVGASFGALLDAAAEAGFRTSALELSPYAVDHLQKSAHRVYTGSPESTRLPEKEFCVITMIELIEHLADPTAALCNIRRAITPDGLLVIQTANMDGRQARRAGSSYHYFLPGHLHYFSRRTLTTMLEKCGFQVKKVYYPCEFGLLPKLQKSRGEFIRARDYLKWFKTASYHLRSKIHPGKFALTSGMVVYAEPSVGYDEAVLPE